MAYIEANPATRGKFLLLTMLYWAGTIFLMFFGTDNYPRTNPATYWGIVGVCSLILWLLGGFFVRLVVGSWGGNVFPNNEARLPARTRQVAGTGAMIARIVICLGAIFVFMLPVILFWNVIAPMLHGSN